MHLKYGLVSDVKKGFAKVNFLDDDFVSDWLPVLHRKTLTDSESWQLEINEHVICLMDEACNEGAVLGAIASEADPGDEGEGPGKYRKVFADGTVIEYDKTAHKLTVDVKGQLEANTTGLAKVTAPNIELTGQVKITGTVTVLGALSAGAISTVPGAGGGDGSISAQGTFNVQGDVNATGDIKAGTVSLKTHTHTSAASGSPTSAPLP